MSTRPAGVVLAAGLGTRLRPLTTLRPKPLCPVGDRPLIDRCLDLLAPHCGAGPEHLAVNAFHLADQVVEHLDGLAEVSVEQQLLGTAGGVAQLGAWRAGRPVLLMNGDAYLAPGAQQPGTEEPAAVAGTTAEHGRANNVLADLLTGWAGRTVRMLVCPADERPDFVDGDDRWRYVGACLLPDRWLHSLRPEPSGLFAEVWQPARAAGDLEFIRFDGLAIDTGTPAGYLAANLHAAGGASAIGASAIGASVIGDGAVVAGSVEQCVVWPGAYVAADESLHRVIRAGTKDDPITVQA